MRPGIDLSLEELLELRFTSHKLNLQAFKRSQQVRHGMHLSQQLGRGLEFVEVRHYQPGDDVRAIDWKITARSNKPHTKLFAEERLQEVYLVVDRRQNMQFGTETAFKAVIAAKVAALLSFVATNQGDAVGGIIVDDHSVNELRPQAGNKGALSFCHALAVPKHIADSMDPAHKARDVEINNAVKYHKGTGREDDAGKQQDTMATSLQHLFRAAKLHSLIIICSDFTPLNATLQQAISVLRTKHQVQAIMINDRLEQELPEAGMLSFSNQPAASLPTMIRQQPICLDSNNSQQRASYQQHFAKQQQLLLNFFSKNAIPRLGLDTSNAWHNTLVNHLAQQFSHHGGGN